MLEQPNPELNPATPVVELHMVVKRFIHSDRDDVKGLSLMVQRGEILVLLGPSGCGKTTTLRLIGGFEQPDGGTVRIQGQLVADKQRCLPPEKRGLGMIFQDYALFPHLTVAENVAFGLHRLPRRQRQARAADVLGLVGLAEFAERYPHALSGGQQQRVALARALAPWPAVILFDEPFSNLDAELRGQMRDEVRRILEKSNSTAVFVTHDQQEAMLMGDRVAVMRRGYVEQIDTPERIFHEPYNCFVADFLGAADFLPARVTAQGLETEIGLLPSAYPLAPGQDLEVMVRPHDLSALPVGAGLAIQAPDGGTTPLGPAAPQRPAEAHGHVVEAEFAGDRWQYRVQLRSGRSVRCHMPHTASYPLGMPVRIALQADHGLVCFRGGRSLRR